MWAVNAYLKMLSSLQASRQLQQIEAVSIPHMKQDAVSKVIRRLQRRVRREKPKPVSSQLMEHMNVVYEPKKEGSDGG